MRAIFALFARSVRDDTRSRGFFWVRMAICLAVILEMWMTNLSARIGGAAGLRFFSSLVWLNFVVICVAGASYFSSAVTEEKEEGTLGLLRMTDLSPLAILLGKSTSRMAGALVLLLVQIPFAM